MTPIMAPAAQCPYPTFRPSICSARPSTPPPRSSAPRAILTSTERHNSALAMSKRRHEGVDDGQPLQAISAGAQGATSTLS